MLKDMAYTKAEAKEEAAECAQPGGDASAKYPWCLTLYLNDEVMKKLGMGLPAVGAELMLTAKVNVTGISQRQHMDGDPEQTVDLQITAMDLAQSVTASDRQSKAASKLYG